jgi:hypothetical protein
LNSKCRRIVFLSLSESKSITIASSQLQLFSLICFDFGNHELIESLFSNSTRSLENLVIGLQLNLTDSFIEYALSTFYFTWSFIILSWNSFFDCLRMIV